MGNLDSLFDSIYGSALPKDPLDDLFDTMYGAKPDEEGNLSPFEKAQRERERMYANAMPALGKTGDTGPLENTVSEKVATAMGMIPGLSGLTVAEKAGVLPEGSLQHFIETAADSALGWTVGIGEAIGLAPKGTRQEMIQQQQADLVSLASNANIPELVIAGEAASTLGGGMLGGAGSQLATKGAGIGAKVIANVAEGLIQGYGETEGLERPERLKGMALVGGLSALGGVSTGMALKREAAEAAARKAASAPKPQVVDFDSMAQDVNLMKQEVVGKKLDADAEKAAGVMMRHYDQDAVAKLEQDRQMLVSQQTAYNALLNPNAQYGHMVVPPGGKVTDALSQFDEMYELITSPNKDVAAMSAQELPGPGVPLMLKGQAVASESMSTNALFPESTPGTVWLEDWMRPVNDVEAFDGDARMLLNQKDPITYAVQHGGPGNVKWSTVTNKTFRKYEAQLEGAVPVGISGIETRPLKGVELNEAMASGELADARMVVNRDTGEALLVADITGGKYTGRHVLKVADPPDPVERGRAAFAGTAPIYPPDHMPSMREAMEIVDGGIDEAQKMLDSITRSGIYEQLRKEASDEVDAILMGDFSNISKLDPRQRLMAAAETRTRIQNQLLLLEQQKEMVPTLVENLTPLTPAEAVSSVARLREKSMAMAADAGDPRIFDEYDYWYRKNEYGNSLLRPDGSDGPVTRTAADAYSEYRDAGAAIMDAVADRAKRMYSRLTKRNRMSIGRDEFVAQQKAAVTAKLNDEYQSLLTIHSGKSSTELIGALDKRTRSILKKYKIDPAEVKFRGDSDWAIEHGIGDGAVWVSKNGGGKRLGDMMPGELVELARKGKDVDAPPAVFDMIANELKRRGAGEVTARQGAAALSPAEVQTRAQQIVSEKMTPEEAAGVLPPKFNEVPANQKWYKRAWSEFITSVKTQAQPDMQVSRNKYIPFLGDSFEHVLNVISDIPTRKAVRGMIKATSTASREVGASIRHSFEVAMTDLDKAVRAHMQVLKAQGLPADRGRIMMQLKQLHEDGLLANIQDEALRNAVVAVDAQLTKAVDDVIKAGHVTDQELLGKIASNRNRWLYRTYSIFTDPDAIFKKIDKTTTAYKNLFDHIKKGNEGKYVEAAVQQLGKKLDHLAPAERAVIVEEAVNRFVDGEINAIIKQHLKIPGEKTFYNSPMIKRAQTDYFLDRVLDDPDIRAIMGEEKHFDMAARASIESLSSDIAAYKMNAGLREAFMKAGLMSDMPVGDNVFVKLSSRTLKDVSKPENAASVGDPVIYAHPTVGKIFEAINNPHLASLADVSIAFIKTGLILTPGGTMANFFGLWQQMLLSRGLANTVWDVVRSPDKALRGKQTIFGEVIEAAQASRELTAPGRAGVKEAQKLYRAAGFKSVEDIRMVAEDMMKYGLDEGGELAYVFQEMTQPMVEGASAGRSKYKAVVRSMMDFYRRPDVMAKVLAFNGYVRELSTKEGVKVPTAAIKREAARMTKMTTQNVETTPSGIRNMSKGWVGVVSGGFQGFMYQMHKNVVMAGKLGLEDLMMASKLAAQGDLKRAATYARYGLDRTATVAAMTYYLTDKLEDWLSEEQDKEQHVRHVMWDDRRNSSFLISKVENKDGKVTVGYVDTGATDVYDPSHRVLNAIGQIPSVDDLAKDPAKFAQIVGNVAQELRVQFLQPGFLMEAAYDIFGLQMQKGKIIPTKRMSADKEHAIVPQLGVTAEGLYKGTRRIAPGVIRGAVDAVRVAAGVANPDLVDPELDKFTAMMSRQTTGFRFGTLDFNTMWQRRSNEDWGKYGSFVSQAKKELESARTFEARNAIIKKYSKQWDKAYNAQLDNVSHARGMGLTPMQILGMLNDKDRLIYVPKEIRSDVVAGRPMSFSAFASKYQFKYE